MIRPAQDEGGVSIDMMPLIDMVFLLLIFFLVATSFHQDEREMQVKLPVAQNAGPISTVMRDLIVNIDANGDIIVGGSTISSDDLRTIVADAVERNPEQKVSVRGDRDVPYGTVVTVLDICKASGIQDPYLDTALDQ
ncbi:MAG: biopolymer transporter ExbD [Planctomycetota bacterium]